MKNCFPFTFIFNLNMPPKALNGSILFKALKSKNFVKPIYFDSERLKKTGLDERLFLINC